MKQILKQEFRAKELTDNSDQKVCDHVTELFVQSDTCKSVSYDISNGQACVTKRLESGKCTEQYISI